MARHPLAPALAAVAVVVGTATYLHFPQNTGAPSSVVSRVVPSTVRVVDGDTIDVIGGETRRYRLVGFDTPETSYARCDAERKLGNQATRRLADLVHGADVRLDVEAGKTDRYGRGLARLKIRGEDIADILVREGLAVHYFGRGSRIDWCRKLEGR